MPVASATDGLGAAAHVGGRVHPSGTRNVGGPRRGPKEAPGSAGVERIKIAVLVFVDGQPPAPHRPDPPLSAG